jgi:hypothetical protein
MPSTALRPDPSPKLGRLTAPSASAAVTPGLWPADPIVRGALSSE